MSSAAPRPPARFAVLLDRARSAQWALAALPLLAVAGPLASPRPGASGFPYFYRIAFVVLLVVTVPLFFAEARRRLLPVVYTVSSVFFALWAPLSILWTAAPRGRALTEVFAALSALAGSWVVLILTRGTDRGLKLLRLGWLVAFAVTMLVVAFEFVTGRHLYELVGAEEYWRFSAYSVAGLDSNPNGLSNFFVGCIAVMAAQLVREAQAKRAIDLGAPTQAGTLARGGLGRTVLLVLGIVTAVYTIFLTGSRAGLLSASFLCVLALVFLVPVRARRMVPALLLAVAVLAQVLPSTTLNTLRPSAIGKQAAEESTVSGHHNDTLTPDQAEADIAASDALRVALTEAGVRYVGQAPIQGHGAGSALTVLEQDPAWEPDVPAKARRIINLHNTYLEVGVNYGLIGLLGVLVVPLLAAAVFLDPRRLGRGFPDARVYEGLGTLWALLVTSIITSTSIGTPSFWLLAAYATALAWNYRDSTRVAAAPTAPAESTPAGR